MSAKFPRGGGGGGGGGGGAGPFLAWSLYVVGTQKWAPKTYAKNYG